MPNCDCILWRKRGFPGADVRIRAFKHLKVKRSGQYLQVPDYLQSWKAVKSRVEGRSPRCVNFFSNAMSVKERLERRQLDTKILPVSASSKCLHIQGRCTVHSYLR